MYSYIHTIGWMDGITFLGRFDNYKGGVRIKLIIYQICIKTMSVKGEEYAH
jgi:hypothetical protein